MTLSYLVEWEIYEDGFQYTMTEDWWDEIWYKTGYDIREELSKFNGSMRRMADGRVFIDFEDEKHATMFALRWM